MLKRRRKLSKDLQNREKSCTFAEDKRHLGKTIKRACCVALDLHYLCKRKRRTEARTVIRIHE